MSGRQGEPSVRLGPMTFTRGRVGMGRAATAGSGPRREHGFTLLELLVVLIIVGLLAAVAVPVYLHQRDKAAAASTTEQMRKVIPLVMQARENQQGHLGAVTGSSCSDCRCRASDGYTMVPVADPAFPTSPCGGEWMRMTSRIAANLGDPVEATRKLFTDGWGYPIVIDENEGYQYACGTAMDLIRSAGPNHVLDGGLDDIRRMLPAGGLC